MSHSFAKNHIHLIFGTKERRKLISKAMQPRLWSYMAGICRNEKIIPIAVNGMDDHAHLLFHLPPSVALAEAVRTIKANSSRWMSEHGKKFAWQDGYAAFSVSVSNTATVAKYIRDQERHHHKMTFAEEYIEFLKRHGVEFDAKYVFD